MSDGLREALSKAMEGKEVENVIDEGDSVIERPTDDEMQANADDGMFGEQSDEGEQSDDGVKASDEDSEDELSERLNDDSKAKKDSGEAPEGKQGDATNDKAKDKPPVGWTPENREHWAKLPQGLKAQITKREQEVNKVLQESSNARKFTQEFERTIAPYQSMMAAEGATNPVQAVNALLQTAATLSMGSKVQKAERIAQLVRHYSIDIEALDSVLAGEQVQQKNDPKSIEQEVERLVNQRLAPYQQQQQYAQQQAQQEQRAKAQQAIAEVQQREFFNDVRLDMADLLEVASRRGIQMTAADAYDKAVALNPEIQSVLQSRKQNNLDGKRNAASSIRGNRSGVADAGGSEDLRSLIEASWNQANSGRM